MSQHSSRIRVGILAVFVFVASALLFANFPHAFSEDPIATYLGGPGTQGGQVSIANAHVNPSTIRVGDNFTITATLVNNSPDMISVHNSCLSPFSVDFDNHAVALFKPCIYFAISKELSPGENMTVTGPGTNVVYRAVSAGTANATITFSYTDLRPHAANQSYVQDPTSVSESILFTIVPGAAPNAPVLLPPLAQVKSGTLAKDVKCEQGFQLLIRSEDGSPACVRPSTASILVERAWGHLQ